MARRPSTRAPSLTRRMVVGVGLPMAALAGVLGIGGALTINSIVEGVSDRLLAASTRAIAETLALENGQVTLDLPTSALGMLESDARDNVYYSVRVGHTLLTGYPDLPYLRTPPHEGDETRYGYATFRGLPIRIAATTRRVPRVGPMVVVEVAETLDARHALRDRMLSALALLELSLLTVLVVLLPLAVRWGLSPLGAIRRDMAARGADFAPLPVVYAPAELRGLILAFNALLGRLENAVQGIRRFTADASHQMRTPLTILKTHVDVLRSAAFADPSARQSVADINAATDRLQRLLTQLLTLARAESAREGAIARVAVDLGATARAVAADFARQAVRAGVELEFDGEEATVFVLGNEGVAAQLVGNLLDNAIRYNRAGGSVVVRVHAPAPGGRVSVIDDGPGIPHDRRAEVFTRFSRLDRDQGVPGSGLGLAIARALADAIGASVMVGDRDDGAPGLQADITFARAESDSRVKATPA